MLPAYVILFSYLLISACFFRLVFLIDDFRTWKQPFSTDRYCDASKALRNWKKANPSCGCGENSYSQGLVLEELMTHIYFSESHGFDALQGHINSLKKLYFQRTGGGPPPL